MSLRNLVKSNIGIEMINHLKPINSIFVLGQKMSKKYSQNALVLNIGDKSLSRKLDCEN